MKPSQRFVERDPLQNFVEFESAAPEHADELVRIRISAMRESLASLGRFDPERARERFLSGFSSEHTRFIIFHGARVGFVVVKPEQGSLKLDHLYIEPEFQRQGIGGLVLQSIFTVADEHELPITVTALRDSDSNQFYQRHGFVYQDESEWDINYVRFPRTIRGTNEPWHHIDFSAFPPPDNMTPTSQPGFAITLIH